jgi:hypothetical protein
VVSPPPRAVVYCPSDSVLLPSSSAHDYTCDIFPFNINTAFVSIDSWSTYTSGFSYLLLLSVNLRNAIPYEYRNVTGRTIQAVSICLFDISVPLPHHHPSKRMIPRLSLISLCGFLCGFSSCLVVSHFPFLFCFISRLFCVHWYVGVKSNFLGLCSRKSNFVCETL